MRVKKKPHKQEAPPPTLGEVDVGPDDGQDFDTLAKDVIGDDGSDSDNDFDKNKKPAFKFGDDDQEEEESKEPAFMFFDFRRGIASWPANAV
jgi:hypothetical protein